MRSLTNVVLRGKMEKPLWRRLSSTYLIESEHLRIRSDTVELPSGVVLPNYYVRESFGFVMVFALTPQREVLLVRQYRYGINEVIVELPAGSIDRGEEPLACARRELLEETGYTAARWEPLVTVPAEPVRSNSYLHAFLAYDAAKTHEQELDATEAIEPYTVALPAIRPMLRENAFGALSCVAVAYAALDRLGA
ncbi:MAG TPA: NUDIX hydrolase [Candidatus Acidoferrales bacterium]|nr:NUDIX hydrolase [Candidatus Acidoferrales bacterium]